MRRQTDECVGEYDRYILLDRYLCDGLVLFHRIGERTHLSRSASWIEEMGSQCWH